MIKFPVWASDHSANGSPVMRPGQNRPVRGSTYLARSCYMLQQGKFVADVIYFYGEDNNITALFGEKLPDIPEGYNYDFVNADALVNVLSVNKGSVTTPSGMTYRVLAFDQNSRYMSLSVLKKIRDLVFEGAIIVGPRPADTPSSAIAGMSSITCQ